MLGGAILVIVLVLIFGVRACVGGKKGNSNKDQTTAQSNQENDPSSPAVSYTHLTLPTKRIV